MNVALPATTGDRLRWHPIGQPGAGRLLTEAGSRARSGQNAAAATSLGSVLRRRSDWPHHHSPTANGSTPDSQPGPAASWPRSDHPGPPARPATTENRPLRSARPQGNSTATAENQGTKTRESLKGAAEVLAVPQGAQTRWPVRPESPARAWSPPPQWPPGSDSRPGARPDGVTWPAQPAGNDSRPGAGPDHVTWPARPAGSQSRPGTGPDGISRPAQPAGNDSRPGAGPDGISWPVRPAGAPYFQNTEESAVQIRPADVSLPALPAAAADRAWPATLPDQVGRLLDPASGPFVLPGLRIRAVEPPGPQASAGESQPASGDRDDETWPSRRAGDRAPAIPASRAIGRGEIDQVTARVMSRLQRGQRLERERKGWS